MKAGADRRNVRDNRSDRDGSARVAIEHLAARRAAKHASAIISSIQDGLLVVDESGRIADVNDRLCAMTGFGRRELIGKSRFPFVSHADARSSAEAIRGTIDGSEIGGETQIAITRKSGERVRVNMSIAPLRNGDGDVLGYAGTVRQLEPRPVPAPGADSPADARRARALQTLAHLVTGDDPWQVVLRRVASEVAKLVDADTARIYRLQDGAFDLRASWSSPPAAASGRPGLDVDAASGPLRAGRPMSRTGRGARRVTDIAYPIVVGSTIWGALVVGSNAAAGLALDAMAELGAFVSVAGLAILSIDARGAIEETASRDSATGLAGRRAFEERLRAEGARAARHGGDLSLVILEIDGTDRPTATGGIEASDRIAATVGQHLGRLGRAGDTIARIRHDAFAWILPETDGRGAELAVERVRAALEGLAPSGDGRVTASFGVSDVATDGHDADRLVRQAEAALRVARTNGGDQVVRRLSGEVSRGGGDGDEHRRRLGRANTAIRLLARVIDEKCVGRPKSAEIATQAERLAVALGWDAVRAADLHDAALVRDVGKIGIPEEILQKQRHSLTPGEREEIARHPITSARIASEVMTEEQTRWILEHHERYDGVQNLTGRRGEAIAEGARIIAIAEKWLELRGGQGHGGGASRTDAVDELRGEAGWQLWPEGVEAMIRLAGEEAQSAAVTADRHGWATPGGRPDIRVIATHAHAMPATR